MTDRGTHEYEHRFTVGLTVGHRIALAAAADPLPSPCDLLLNGTQVVAMTRTFLVSLWLSALENIQPYLSTDQSSPKWATYIRAADGLSTLRPTHPLPALSRGILTGVVIGPSADSYADQTDNERARDIIVCVDDTEDISR